MKSLKTAAVLAFAAFATVPALAQAPSDPAAGRWSASGTLLESCTCAVPCTCNFGEGPSPHSYCHAVFAYRIDKGAWNGVDLSGLVVGGADGPNGGAGFLDNHATTAQKPALENLGRAIFAQGGPAGGPRSWVSAPITHLVQGNNLRLAFGSLGGFSARVIIGRDGKSPVVVENNTVWPIARAIKGKALPLQFETPGVGRIHGDGTNANYGTFAFTGRTSEVAVAAPPAKKALTTGASCCAPKKPAR